MPILRRCTVDVPRWAYRGGWCGVTVVSTALGAPVTHARVSTVRWIAVTAAAVLVLLSTGVASSGAAPPPGRGGGPPAQPGNRPVAANPPILLEGYSFSPGLGERPDLPPGLEVASYAVGQRGLHLIQFDGPIQPRWKDQVETAGAQLVTYVPEFAFIARMTPGTARRVERLAPVAWVGIYQPAYKLAPGVDVDADEGLYVVERLTDDDSKSPELITADGQQLRQLARQDDVIQIHEHELYELHNEYGAGVITGTAAANAAGYDGSGQVVAVADTGIGGGTASTAHADVPASRVTAIRNWPGVSDSCWTITDDGAVDADSGHGTHTALSVLGDGGTEGKGIGSAPGAALVFQAVENWAAWRGICKSLGYPDGYYLPGLNDLAGLFTEAYGLGARVHSNSWGQGPNCLSDYPPESATTDRFIWNHPDMTITFSAGNAGTDADGDGGVDGCSVGAPATAKNVITVGASENARDDHFPCDAALTYTSCAGQGGRNSIFTYGAAWPSDYPAEPLKSDPSAGNAEQLAAFSSRGPTVDGRFKPDLVAPGTWVLSGYSNLYQQGYGGSTNPRNGAYQYDGWGFPLNAAYKYMGGTSMSNPIVAGAAAIVRQFYDVEYGHDASAALVKALLINSAVDLLDENNDGVDDNHFPIPNHHEGWGRVDAAAAVQPHRIWFDDPRLADAEHDSAALETGQHFSTTVDVAAPGRPLKATLVWSDWESDNGAKDLVNDLDLIVTAPDGTVYWGNRFSGGWSEPGENFDDINNVENVFVEVADIGTWTIEVNAFNVPTGPQPFSLVVDAPVPPPSATWSDFDGDGATDIGIYRPATGQWASRGLTNDVFRRWGGEADVAVPGDYDGDGLTDVAIFRPSNGLWWSDGAVADVKQVWGGEGDVPVPGDYDGDGTTDLAVFRPSTGEWLVRASTGDTSVRHGRDGDIPTPADLDGDGALEVLVYRPDAGAFMIQGSGRRPLGGPGMVPVPADYDGDGTDDLAVFDPADGTWTIQMSGYQAVRSWGQPGDMPVPADYDGDGQVDLAVFRPETGEWWIDGTTRDFLHRWGHRHDVLLPLPWATFDSIASGS